MNKSSIVFCTFLSMRLFKLQVRALIILLTITVAIPSFAKAQVNNPTWCHKYDSSPYVKEVGWSVIKASKDSCNYMPQDSTRNSALKRYEGILSDAEKIISKQCKSDLAIPVVMPLTDQLKSLLVSVRRELVDAEGARLCAKEHVGKKGDGIETLVSERELTELVSTLDREQCYIAGMLDKVWTIENETALLLGKEKEKIKNEFVNLRTEYLQLVGKCTKDGDRQAEQVLSRLKFLSVSPCGRGLNVEEVITTANSEVVPFSELQKDLESAAILLGGGKAATSRRCDLLVSAIQTASKVSEFNSTSFGRGGCRSALELKEMQANAIQIREQAIRELKKDQNYNHIVPLVSQSDSAKQLCQIAKPKTVTRANTPAPIREQSVDWVTSDQVTELSSRVAAIALRAEADVRDPIIVRELKRDLLSVRLRAQKLLDGTKNTVLRNSILETIARIDGIPISGERGRGGVPDRARIKSYSATKGAPHYREAINPGSLSADKNSELPTKFPKEEPKYQEPISLHTMESRNRRTRPQGISGIEAKSADFLDSAPRY